MSSKDTLPVEKEKSEESEVETEMSLSEIMRERLAEIRQVSSEAIYFDVNANLTKSENWKPEYKVKLIEHLAKGKSVESFLGKVGATYKEFESWCEQFPEIKRYVEIGENLSLGQFEELGQLVALGLVKGNASMLWNIMKNRHPDKFKDKVDVEHSGDLTFMFDTGIKRDLDGETSDFKEVHSQTLDDSLAPDGDIL